MYVRHVSCNGDERSDNVSSDDSSNSSTYTLLAQGNFSTHYATVGSGVLGNYISDDLVIGDMIVNSFTMAVAT